MIALKERSMNLSDSRGSGLPGLYQDEENTSGQCGVATTFPCVSSPAINAEPHFCDHRPGYPVRRSPGSFLPMATGR
jgi:hypothetical protein